MWDQKADESRTVKQGLSDTKQIHSMIDRLVNFFTNAHLKKMSHRKEETTFIVKHSKTEYQQFQGCTHWVQLKIKNKNSQSETNSMNHKYIQNNNNKIICYMWGPSADRDLKRGYFCLPDYSMLFYLSIPKE